MNCLGLALAAGLGAGAGGLLGLLGQYSVDQNKMEESHLCSFFQKDKSQNIICNLKWKTYP